MIQIVLWRWWRLQITRWVSGWRSKIEMFVGFYCTFVGPFFVFLARIASFLQKTTGQHSNTLAFSYWSLLEFSTQDAELFLSICPYPLVPDLQHAGRGNFWQGRWEGSWSEMVDIDIRIRGICQIWYVVYNIDIWICMNSLLMRIEEPSSEWFLQLRSCLCGDTNPQSFVKFLDSICDLYSLSTR